METSLLSSILEVVIGSIILLLLFTFVDKQYVLDISYLICLVVFGYRFIKAQKNTD